MKILGVIPARYESTRFPGKVLADIKGQTMVERVFKRSVQSQLLSKVIVATENEKVFATVEAFGGEAVMTDASHASGTDRCFEALQKQDDSYDYVINIQGDEPFINPAQIDELAALLNGKAELATLIKKITTKDELFNMGEVKTIFNKEMEALYFSRQPIPYQRSVAELDWLQHEEYYKHIGIYAYRADILKQISTLPVSKLEKSESLEQLRWLENGYKIKLATTEYETVCIDTREDLDKVLATMNTEF